MKYQKTSTYHVNRNIRKNSRKNNDRRKITKLKPNSDKYNNLNPNHIKKNIRKLKSKLD